MHTSSRHNQLPLTPQAQYILLALAAGHSTGYEIIQLTLQDSEGLVRLSPGSVYPTLQRFVKQGLVINSPTAAITAKAVAAYQLTDIGWGLLLAETKRQQHLIGLAERRRAIWHNRQNAQTDTEIDIETFFE
jgi:DNA-binding PadR family transcriptional regulator